MKKILFIIFVFISVVTSAQVHKVDAVDYKEMTTTKRDAWTGATEGTTIFNTTTKKINVYDGTTWNEVGGVDSLDAVDVDFDDSGLTIADGDNVQSVISSIDGLLLKTRGTEISSEVIVSVNATTFNLSPIKGMINNSNGFTNIDYAGASNIAVTNISAPSTYVFINDSGVVGQQTSEPTRLEMREKMFVCRLASSGTALIAFEYLYNPSGQYSNSVRDLYEYLRGSGVPLRKGFDVTPNANLTFQRAAGSIYEFGGNGSKLSPSENAISSVAQANLFHLTSTSSSGTASNILNVNQYDLNGAFTTLNNNRYVAHRLYLFSSGNHAIQLGQEEYLSLELAKANCLIEPFIVNPTNLNGEFLGWWIVKKGTVNLTNDVNAYFLPYSIGGQSGSAVVGSLLAANNLSDLDNVTSAVSNLGLGNVDDTSDLNKPVSTATQASLDLKADIEPLNSKSVKLKVVDGSPSEDYIIELYDSEWVVDEGGSGTVDQTIIDGSTNAVSGNAVFDGLANKLNLSGGTMTGELDLSLLMPSSAVSFIGSNDNPFSSGSFKDFNVSDGSTLIDYQFSPTSTALSIRTNSLANQTAYTAKYTLPHTGTPSIGTDLITKSYADATYGVGGIEEGTFTADLVDTNGGATYSGTKSFSYYRVGKLVYIFMNVASVTVTGTPTGKLIFNNIVGLPSFTPNLSQLNVFITSNSETFYSVNAQASNVGTGDQIKIYRVYETIRQGNSEQFPAPSALGSIKITGTYITNN